MLTFLHTADWQIGRQYARFLPEDAALLAEARFDAVSRVASLAVEHQVDMVLVAGDVFDSQTLADRQIIRCFRAMAGFSGAWLLLPGNHDAALSESVWTRAQRLGVVPDHVHLLLRPEPWRLDALGVVVFPGVLTQRQSYQDLTAWFDTVDTDRADYRIGLAHGSVQGILAEHIDSHNPIAADRARQAGLDYLALGDWHGARQINERTWYSGTPEPDRFKDNQPGHVLLVKLASPGSTPEVQMLPSARYHWHSLSFSFTEDDQVQELARLFHDYGLYSVIELQLEGHLSLEATGRLDELLMTLSAQVRSLDVNRDQLRLSATEHDLERLHVDGYVKQALEDLRAQQALGSEQGQAAGDALLLMAQLLAQAQQE